jgi:NAD(P)-dependent dehydrogenase (short-subunit alcohol dehydrogenase family)
MKLAGKTAVITGGSHGLGLAIASAFLREGCDVIVCGRNADDVRRAREQLAAGAPGRRVFDVAADVSSEADNARLFALAAKEFGRLDILVCNAGILGAKGLIDEIDLRDFERAIEINVYGPIRNVRHALPLLKKAARPKIVITSGGGAERPSEHTTAYSVSKTALVRFAECFSLQLGSSGDVNMLGPGQLNTRMADEVLASGPQGVGPRQFAAFAKIKETNGGASIPNAAECAVFLASAASDGISGRLIHAVRDPWQDKLALHKDEIAKSDALTLRRIDAKDRGITW